jgi:hypothetical protein
VLITVAFPNSCGFHKDYNQASLDAGDQSGLIGDDDIEAIRHLRLRLVEV